MSPPPRKGRRPLAPLPEPIARELAGKRFALVGFEDQDFLEISRAIDSAQAFARRMTKEDLQAADSQFDLIVVRLSGEDAASPEPISLSATRKPVLLAGPIDRIMQAHATTTGPIQNFVVWPAEPQELLLRAYEVLTSSRTAVPAPPARKREKPLVVIADDDATTSMMVQAVLQRFGMECRVASDGSQALELAREHLPDVLVLDVNMPFLDGFEVLANIKGNPATRGIIVVMLTSVHQEVDVARGFGLGADDYVTKPFNPIELVARIKRFLRRPG